MSEATQNKTLRDAGEHLSEIGVEAAWLQWSALGAGTLTENQSASAIVDPEALLLLSLYLIPREKRLRDLTRWWAETGSELLSVQRTKTLARDFPDSVREPLRRFSYWSVEAGDRRWKKYAEESAQAHDRGRKGPDEPTLHSPAALLLRLRAGFGVSAKADALAFLVGMGEQAVTVSQTVRATGYSRATISGALNDLARAGFIAKGGGRPAEYRALLRPWRLLLFESEPDQPGNVDPGQGTSSQGTSRRRTSRRGTTGQGENDGRKEPGWRYWGQLFAFLARSREWMREAESSSEYIASTQARDLFEDFRWALEANRIQVPSPTRYQGREYLARFVRGARQTASWIANHL
jgi:hypothetical protein